MMMMMMMMIKVTSTMTSQYIALSGACGNEYEKAIAVIVILV